MSFIITTPRLDSMADSSVNPTSESANSSSSGGSPNIVEHAASYLIGTRKLQYNEIVNPNTEEPRDVDQVWRDIVGLFDPSKPRLKVLVCPQALKNVMKADHTRETEFNKSLFNELRTALANEQLIDACKNKNVTKRHEEPIVFKSEPGDRFAVGIQRKANCEQPTDREPTAFNNTEATSASVTPASTRVSDSGVVARARLDHCACLLNKDGIGEWEAEDCLSVVELKLTSGSNNECKTFGEEDLKGEDYAKWLDLAFNHGAIAQAMLYTMAWVVPSLAKLGQLDRSVPWAVVVGKRKPKPPAATTDATTPRRATPNTRARRISQYRAAIRRLQALLRTLLVGRQLRNGSIVTNSTAAIDVNHWVSGNNYVPQACGDYYRYAVTGYGLFPKTNTTDDESWHKALSVYLETLYFGLCAAKKWLDKFRAGNGPCRPLSTSGKDVMIGDHKLIGLKLRGRAGRFVKNPMVSPAAAGARLQDREWTINQGEIFTGRLNVFDLTRLANLQKDGFLVISDVDEEVNVAVKVSSVAVHNYLTIPEHAWIALREIFGILEAIKAARERCLDKRKIHQFTVRSAESTEMEKTVAEGELTAAENKLAELHVRAPAISDMLLAVHKTRTGLVTIMADLSAQHYTALPPSRYKDLLDVLWRGFLQLVKEVLLPIAELGIIHPDLRPGNDETANILCKLEGEGVSRKAIMKIIDFESLVHAATWTRPKGEDSLYVQPQTNAKTFLWWQVFAIAYAWKHKKPQKEMAGIKLVIELGKLRNDPNSWSHCFLSGGTLEMTQDLVEKLDDVFPATDNRMDILD